MRVVVTATPGHSFHSLQLRDGDWSGTCFCGYRGPRRGTEREAHSDWQLHVLNDVGDTAVAMVYLIKLVASTAYTFTTGSAFLSERGPLMVEEAKGILGHVVHVQVPGLS